MKEYVFVVESLCHETLLKIKACTTREIRARLGSDDFVVIHKHPVKTLH